MDPLVAETTLRQYLDGSPEAQHAALHDPEFAAAVHQLREFLGHVDDALAEEGTPLESRHRVAGRVVAACLDAEGAQARMAERAKLLHAAMTA